MAWTDLLHSVKDFITRSFINDSTVKPEISEKQLKAYIADFLQDEPDWIPRLIKRDPALSEHLKNVENSSEAQQQAVLHEVLKEALLYQGLHAIAIHKAAHALHQKHEFAQARALSQAARKETAGIEIHPGATIGKNFFIDHGTGVVIGGTAIIGDNVMLYHRVTLGSDGSKQPHGKPRHPKIGNNVTICTGAEVLGAATVGDDVVIGAGTKIIGNVTIGDGAKIGPQLVIRKDVKPGEVIIGLTASGDFIHSDTYARTSDWTSRVTANMADPTYVI